MGLLWVSMMTGPMGVLFGFEWFKNGITLPQVLVGTTASCLLLLIYTVPIAYFAAKTGKGYSLLNKELFGERLGGFINLILILIFTGFYGLNALLCAEAVTGMFHLGGALPVLAALTALVMSFNNFFGFRGVANFARFLAAPAMIAWIAVTFIKAVPALNTTVHAQLSHPSFIGSLMAISSLLIGVSIWGNEADYWKFGKARPAYSAVPLIAAFALGGVLFPVTGWMVASQTGVTDFATAASLLKDYSFGGNAVLAALVLAACYFAGNDSNLFGSTVALENLIGWPHRRAVTALTLAGVACAYGLSKYGSANALDTIAAINCIFMPMATVIVLCEWYLSRRISFYELGKGTSARAAAWGLAVGLLVGVATAGVIPGTDLLHVGIACLQGWVAACCVYLPLRVKELRLRAAAVAALGAETPRPATISSRL
jgi:purine-cytosine permease-like protein